MENFLSKNRVNLVGFILGALIGIILYLFPLITAFKLILGILGVVLVLYKPEFGLYFTVLLLPLVSFRYVILVFGITTISFIFKMFTVEAFTFKKMPIKYSIVLFLVPLFFATMTSFTLLQSIVRLVVYLIAFLFLFISINLIDSKQKLYYMIIAAIVSATIVGLYGLYQYKAGIELKEVWIDQEQNPDIQMRIISTFDNPNILAEYLILTIPITFALLYNSNSLLKKLFSLFGIAVQGMCILLTYSRGGWLGLFLAMLIFAFFVDRKLLLLYAVAGIGLIIINPKSIVTRLITIVSLEDSSNAYRILLWKASIHMIRDFWLNGIGLGIDAFRAIYPQYMMQGIVAAHSHNVFLQLFVEAGIFGLVGFVVFVFNSLRINFIAFVKGVDIKIKRISISVVASILGLLLHGLVDYVFFSNRIIMMFWVLISIGIVGYMLEFDSKEE
jgi:putative inorganic carbon (HCO3(-)) transporter